MSKFKKSREIARAVDKRQAPYHYDQAEYDEFDIHTGAIQRVHIANDYSVDPSKDGGIQIVNEIEDLNDARVNTNPKFDFSQSRQMKRTAKNDDYEAYYK